MNSRVKTLCAIAFLAGGIAFSTPAIAREDFSKPIDDLPVGDFNASPKSQIQIIEDGPTAHPFRSAPSESDTGTEMAAAWGKWHKDVSSVIHERFNTAARTNFRQSAALKAKVSYMVAKDGRIGNIRIIEPSKDPVYNTMVVSIIKAMAHNPVLEYPAGSKREFVENSETFTWNKGDGVDSQPAHVLKGGSETSAK